jgi:hypothetical protein
MLLPICKKEKKRKEKIKELWFLQGQQDSEPWTLGHIHLALGSKGGL